MTREEVVTLMCNTVDEFNRYSAAQNNFSAEQIEEFILAGREQMEFVNGMLYDVLRDHGVIAEWN
jgi:hypothetical protein